MAWNVDSILFCLVCRVWTYDGGIYKQNFKRKNSSCVSLGCSNYCTGYCDVLVYRGWWNRNFPRDTTSWFRVNCFRRGRSTCCNDGNNGTVTFWYCVWFFIFTCNDYFRFNDD